MRKKPVDPPELYCALGEPWLGPHPLCAALTALHCGVAVEDVPVTDFSRYVTRNTLRQGSLFDLWP